MAEQSPVPDSDVAANGAAEEPRVVGVDSADADAVLGAVSSGTARTVLSTLQDEPASASAVAERTDLALQTVQYHLDNLGEVGLVEVVDTRTSEKGREMDVYGPGARPVVVVAGDDGEREDLRATLSRLGSAVGLLALVSLLIQEVLGGGVGALFGADTGAQVGAAAAESAGGAAGIEPGLLFFAGGLAVLCGWAVVQYLRG